MILKVENFYLPNVLDLIEASHLLDCFIKMEPSNLKIDAKNVELVGTQCLQILLSAKNKWQENNLDFILVNPSKIFLETMLVIGMADDDLTYRSQDVGGGFCS